MIIDNIKVDGHGGYVDCKSIFYSASDAIPEREYIFNSGVNELIGEIDSGVWAISCFLSMYLIRPKEFIIFEQPSVFINGISVSIKELSEYSCYMDQLYPLFSPKKTIRKLVDQGLKHSGKKQTADEIRTLFQIAEERFERPIKQVGNEKFRAMAAIGYSHGKTIFCFPWLSYQRFEYYHGNLTDLLKILEKLKSIVIVPIGLPTCQPPIRGIHQPGEFSD